MSKYLVTTIKTAALLLAVLLMLTACGGSPKEEPPQVYVIGEDSLPSLNALVTLADDISFTQSTGEDGETITYTYSVWRGKFVCIFLCRRGLSMLFFLKRLLHHVLV